MFLVEKWNSSFASFVSCVQPGFLGMSRPEKWLKQNPAGSPEIPNQCGCKSCRRVDDRVLELIDYFLGGWRGSVWFTKFERQDLKQQYGLDLPPHLVTVANTI